VNEDGGDRRRVNGEKLSDTAKEPAFLTQKR
jgi:hypothetical protein